MVSWKHLCIIFIYLFLPANTLILAEDLLAYQWFQLECLYKTFPPCVVTD